MRDLAARFRDDDPGEARKWLDKLKAVERAGE
jgi:hypothetical protein